MRSVWSWWAENQSIIEDNQNGSLLEPQYRKVPSREAFLNVHYIQNLFELLCINGALKRVSDPLSSAYHTWHRIDCLLGNDRLLPYDPATPVVPLQLDGSLRIDCNLSSLKPWRDCFCAWLTEPAMLTLNDSESLLKSCPAASHHWSHIYRMYNSLKELFSQTLTNGASQ